MASITRESNGRKTIQFVGADGLRRSIRLGKASMGDAETVKSRVEDLASAKVTGHAWDNATAVWVREIETASPTLYDRLAAVGLVPKRQAMDEARLGAFLDAYIIKRSDVKPATRITFDNVRRNLIGHFGETRLLRDITEGDAEDFRLYLIGEELADNTVRRRLGIARQLFRRAVKSRLIASNPFADMKGIHVRENRARMYFVSREEAQAVLDACPDAEWRLLFALSRYGGLRCPSEHLLLRWTDVDWERNRLTVHSPKTEHHEGGESRLVPIFPELLLHLRDVFEQAEPGTEYVITRYRDTTVNLRTQLLRIIRRAGLEPWPKLWQNLRSTRQTELAETWPLHVVCAWIGNTQAVAAKHYLQVTEEHFQQAVAADPGIAEAVQNPVQQPVRTPSQGDATPHEIAENSVKHGDSDAGHGRQGTRTPDLLGVNETL